MSTSGPVGSVAGLWRFPVKSMAGERLEQAALTGRGLLGDRAYALIDAETGKVGSAKSVKLFHGILDCRASVTPQLFDGHRVVVLTLVVLLTGCMERRRVFQTCCELRSRQKFLCTRCHAKRFFALQEWA